MMRLEPNECVFRLCRICAKPMSMTYEWDSDYRWYIFYCEKCDVTVSLGDNIGSDFREMMHTGDSPNNEPLTKEEMKYQSSDESNEAQKEMIVGVERDMKKRRTEKSEKEKRLKFYSQKEILK